MRLLSAIVVLLSLPGGAFSVNKPQRAAEQILWQHPGRVEAKDLRYGPGGRAGQPAAPFQFVKEDSSGSTPKITVLDARGRLWSVKWGEEVHSDTFASRLAWAVGYLAEPTYYVESGRVDGVAHKELKRSQKFIGPRGEFREARFQLRSQPERFLKDRNWSWSNNPFLGTRELNGLKVMLLLTSNWDNKDARDVDRDTNTGIFQRTAGGQVSYLYLVQDWGATMGRWGNVAKRSKWDCIGYDDETRHFLKGVDKNGFIEWGYRGQHTGDARDNISINDVRWLMQYLGRLTDRQILAGLRASGATEGEERCYLASLRSRIEQLRTLP